MRPFWLFAATGLPISLAPDWAQRLEPGERLALALLPHLSYADVADLLTGFSPAADLIPGVASRALVVAAAEYLDSPGDLLVRLGGPTSDILGDHRPLPQRYLTRLILHVPGLAHCIFTHAAPAEILGLTERLVALAPADHRRELLDFLERPYVTLAEALRSTRALSWAPT